MKSISPIRLGSFAEIAKGAGIETNRMQNNLHQGKFASSD